jgi:hypothetical protein
MTVSCNEAFLDLRPIAVETEDTFYKDFATLDYTATAAYGILAASEVDLQQLLGFGSITSDDAEAGGENVNDNPLWQRLDRLTHSSNEADMNRAYGYWYKGIRFTNEFMEKLPDVLVKDPKADPQIVTQRVAEMKFLRAFYHFMLVQDFGGIVIADKTIDPAMYNTPRNSIAQVLHFVEQDLENAIPDLKEKSEQLNEVGRASKGAARALLSKVLLYESSYAKNYPDDERFAGCEQKWAQTLKYAEEVINSNQYALVGIKGETFPSWRDPDNGVAGYRWVFTVDGDNSPESVWETQNVQDGMNWVLTRGTYMVTYTTIRFYNNNSQPTINKTAGGWSLNLPTKYMLSAFGNNDPRETGLNSLPSDPKLDPRFSTTIGVEGDKALMNDSKDGLGWYKMNFINLPTKTISRKYECSPAEYWNIKTSDNEGPMNVRYIRYSDVILMAAEAAFESGNTSKSMTYVNMVRTRARMSGKTGFPQDLTAFSFEDIVHERRLELAMEGHRFFDLVRWRLAKKYIGGTKLAALGDDFTVDFIEGKHEFFPIPPEEMQLNKGMVQYPGW